jgi:hypothetical protein
MAEHDWHVTGQRPDEEFNEAHTGFEQVVHVHYVVDKGPSAGVKGIVTVPVSHYSAEHVGEIIEDRVQRHHEVASL